MSTPAAYWEARAVRHARTGRGLAAVCSYGMPAFHNAAIDLTQRAALSPWLRVAPGMEVLDLGCGIGRWSRRLARAGAAVTGVDLAPTMVEEARRRTAEEGLSERCRFEVGDLAAGLALGRVFERVVCVTVLQHVLEEAGLRRAVASVARHLAPGGRALVVEAAPDGPDRRCDTFAFRARSLGEWTARFEEAGLRLLDVAGVDPVPLRRLLLPRYATWPRALQLGALALATGAALPLDLVLARLTARGSWHKVLVLERRP